MRSDPPSGSSDVRPRAAPPALVAVLALLLPVLLVSSPIAVRAAPPAQAGEPGAQVFQSKCAGCHTIGGGKRVGPDLKGVTGQRDPEWLSTFIQDPNALFDANDPIAQELLAEYQGLKMPALGLSPQDVDAVIAYMESASSEPAAGSAPSAGAPVDTSTAGAVQGMMAGNSTSGRLLFRGERAFANGGPSCLACHSVNGIGGLGGGALGPDLTHVLDRYGEAGLTGTLANIVFPTMVGPFAGRPLTTQEQADLVAFLKETNQEPAAPPVAAGAITAATGLMFGAGLAGALALFAVLLFFWPSQRQSISARLRARSGSWHPRSRQSGNGGVHG